jgi:hypothetical protein
MDRFVSRYIFRSARGNKPSNDPVDPPGVLLVPEIIIQVIIIPTLDNPIVVFLVIPTRPPLVLL